MDLRHLRTFRAVAELGSLSRASDHLHVAQPALSKHIKQLEHDLRTTLFVRHGRGMVLTDAGRVLFEKTSGLVRQFELVREEIRNIAGRLGGRVVLGMVPTVSGVIASTVANQVVRNYPEISLRMVDAYGRFLVDWLHQGEIDIAVIHGPAQGLHVETLPLISDQLCAIGPIGSGLAQQETVTLEWTSTFPLVLPSSPHALRLLIDDAYAAAGLIPDIRVEADSFQALLDIVGGGIGLTFLPYYAAAKRIKLGLIEAAPLNPALRRELVLALPPKHRGSLAVNAVAEIVRKEVCSFDSDAPGDMIE